MRRAPARMSWFTCAFIPTTCPASVPGRYRHKRLLKIVPMLTLAKTPLEQVLAGWWSRVDSAYKRAFYVVLLVNLLAFGFEMTNLTIDHDDLWEIFLEDDILGHYIGRFALGWIHLYTQGAHIMPFLQVAEGITVMTLYGLLVARVWGLTRTLDIVLVASVLCVFPYMAQVNSYNAVIVPYSIAHFLSAGAVALSIGPTRLRLAFAALLYVGAFLIYQSVIANAATIFVVWLLTRILFDSRPGTLHVQELGRATIAAVFAVAAGGVLYVAIVKSWGVQFDSYQSADAAFNLEGHADILGGLSRVLVGTLAFFFWPEAYFPDYLKKLQLVLLLGAGVVCVWLPDRISKKAVAAVFLAAALFTPRLLQLLHPLGNFHNLTLTAYAVTVAGFVMIITRAGNVLTRNLSAVLSVVLLGGYLIQANWISTVNYFNTLAQYTTLTQILARVRAIPNQQWDAKRIVFIGELRMQPTYPFKPAIGVATPYIGAKLVGYLAKLMRDDLVVLPPEAVPKASEYAALHLPWPHPDSVAVVDGVGVVVLSNEQRGRQAQGTADQTSPLLPQ